ncbi:MAG: hypothetical protein D6813_11495, partial [Calditrichaeota bacterium]
LLPIVPHPQEIWPKKSGEYFLINSDTKLLAINNSVTGLRKDLSLFKDYLIEQGLHIQYSDSSIPISDQNIIIIGELNEPSGIIDSLVAAIGIQVNEKYPGSEGYILDISPKRVLVAGYDSAGTFYGIQSLLQLISRENDELKIKAVTIIDYPDMPLRSAFYGFYLNALEDDSLIQRAYNDFKKIAQYKFNMIDLASHHYSHLAMEVPGHRGEKLWQRFNKIFEAVRRCHLQPRVGGWAKWINTNSPWGADLTTLECIHTKQFLRLKDTKPCTLKISSGQIAPNVIFNLKTGKSWKLEPVVVTDISGQIIYEEDKDYIINFGGIHSEDYQKYQNTSQTYLQVLFSKVYFGEGEPRGYPLRWGQTFNPPTTIHRTPNSRIHDGQTVKVTFSYIGPDPWSILKVRYCRSDPRLHTDGRQNYIWRWCTEPIRYLGANDFALDVDETRVFAWDLRCLSSGKSRSQIWADDIRYYYKTIRQLNPKARIFIWSDMIDPAHNARIYGTSEVASLLKDYGMMDLVMIPWKSTISEKSVRFFARHGFPIMPSCQDITSEGYSTAPQWAYWVRRFYRRKQQMPYGLMHCKWGYAFDSQQTWEQLATVADHAWSVAPYILHRPVTRAKADENIYIKVKWEGDKLVFDGKKIRSGPLAVKTAFLYYKTSNMDTFTKVRMKKDRKEYIGVIDGSKVKTDEILYYLELSDGFNTSYSPKLGPELPYKIQILRQ